MNISLSKINVGDIIDFKYTGFLKKCGAKGKVVHMPNKEYGTINVAVNAGNVWAVKPANLTILSVEKPNGTIYKYNKEGECAP